MSTEIIETDQYLMKVHENSLLEYTVKEGVEIDIDFLWEIKSTLEALRPGHQYYILADGIGFFTITKEARALSATKEFSSHIAAVAFYTLNYSLKLMSDVYNKINKPAIPTQTFSDRESAMEWLQEQMNNQQQQQNS